MLKFMENETLIFRAWFRKYLKSDKSMKGIDIAKATGLSGPTISSYHGEGKRKSWANFENRKAILKVTGVSHEEMMRIGKKELEPEKKPDKDEIKAYVKELLSETTAEKNLETKVISIDQKHAEIIKKFQNRNMALAINQELLDLENIDPDKLKSVLDFIRWQKKESKEATKKREAGNDKQ
jgi:hypothetical protein